MGGSVGPKAPNMEPDNTDGCQDRGVTWPLLLAEPIQAGSEPLQLQQLIQSWRAQAYTTGLHAVPELMVIQLNRFNLQGRPIGPSCMLIRKRLQLMMGLLPSLQRSFSSHRLQRTATLHST